MFFPRVCDSVNVTAQPAARNTKARNLRRAG